LLSAVLVFELPHEPLALAFGVLLIAKPKRLVMVLFVGLGMARIALHIHQYPRNQSKECSLWNCHSAAVLKDQTFQCHCSSLKYPTGIEVEWNHVEAPPLNQNFLAIITPFGSRGSFNVDQWKRSKGIHGRLSPLTKTTERESTKQRFRDKSSDGCKRVKQWRESIHAAIDSSFSKDTGGFLRAISTGDKSKLSFHMKAAFAHAGIGHLLAGQWIPRRTHLFCAACSPPQQTLDHPLHCLDHGTGMFLDICSHLRLASFGHSSRNHGRSVCHLQLPSTSNQLHSNMVCDVSWYDALESRFGV
jgi:hypothetical protein